MSTNITNGVIARTKCHQFQNQVPLRHLLAVSSLYLFEYQEVYQEHSFNRMISAYETR